MTNVFEFKNYSVQFESNIISPQIKKFIETHHYSKTARSMKPTHVFTLWYEDLLVGVAIYGQPCGKGVVTVHGSGTVELRRVALLDEAPKNSESYFISRTLKLLGKLGIPKVISYADPMQGHSGVMYKALNFKYLGTGWNNGSAYIYNGKTIHSRMVYQKGKNGQYMKSALMYQKLRKQGLIKRIAVQGKHIYLYNLESR